jgi:hypothetical protein
MNPVEQRAVRESAARRGIASHWAVLGVAFTFAEAITRVSYVCYRSIERGLSLVEWLVFAALVASFGYWEGERALRRRFAPTVVARAFELESTSARRWMILLAPLYAMSLVGAARSSLVRSWVAVAGIAAAVIVVRQLPSPFRGLVDGAVAVALSVGLLGLLTRFYAERRRGRP